MIQNRNGPFPGEKAITCDKLGPIKHDIKKLDERVSNLEECCDKLDEELVTEKIIVDDIQVNGNAYLGDIESSGVHCACGFVGNSATVTDITTDNITVNCCARIKDAHIEKAVIDNLTFEEETVDDMTINCHLQVDGSSCFTNTINGNITNADTSETSNNACNANNFDNCSADDWRDYIVSQIPTCAADSAKFAGKDCDEWKTIIKETCVDNAVSADTATNLASNPQLSIGSIDCCAITVTAGNMTSQEFTVPYASEASTAGLANNSTCFDGKTYVEACADILSGCAAKANEATCLKDAPVLSCNGSCIYVTAGNKNSNCITVPYSKCSAATLINASGADTTFPIIMDSTAGNASGYHSFIKDCGNNLTYNPSKDTLQSPNISATNCLKGSIIGATNCITTPKIEATCVITCGVCNNGNSNINGDVNIGGDLYVTGTAHYTHSEEVVTQSENIILRDEATTPVPSGHYSGFVVTNYDGNGNDLEVGADSAGTLKIGTCASNMEAVATRDDSDNMEDSYATKWCASCKKIVTSGIACTHDLCVNGDACATGSVTANTFCGSLVGNADTATDSTCFGGCTYSEACADILSGNAASASKLSTSCCINGTAFDGSSNITTTKWGTARNVQISDCDGTNISGTVSVDGSANVCLKLPSTIKATLTGKADSAKAVTTCPTTVNATCYITLSANNTAGDKQIYTNTNLKYNPSTGALSATTFCGSFTGTSDNATCFDGHTYSCACADIRSGLTSCVGTVTCVKIGSGTAITPDANGQICLPDYPPDLSSCQGINCTGTVTSVIVNGVAGTGTGAITVSNVPACGGCADTAYCSKTVCVVAENTATAYAIPLVKDWNCSTIANATLKGSSNNQLTFNPSNGVLESRFVHVVCNVKTPAIYSLQTNGTVTGTEFYGHRADNTNKLVACANGNGFYRALYGECGNANYKIPFTTIFGTTAAGTTGLSLDRVATADTFTYNSMYDVLRVGTVCGTLKSGRYVTCTPTTQGQAGTYIYSGGIEIMKDVPYIDFHHNNTCADYSARLINSAAGRADIIVNNATGCCASTSSSTFQFCYDGILNAPYFSSDRTVKGEFGHSNEFNLTGTGTYMWLNYRGGSKEIKVGNGNGAGGIGVVCAACFCGVLCGYASHLYRKPTAGNSAYHVFLTSNNTLGSASAYTSCVCPLTFNPSTGVLTAKCFCGCVTATGTIDNATCFAGCTYASAKTDIRSGLTSCTGTVTISNSNANSSIPIALCTGSTSVGKSTGNALCYNPFSGALCARQFNSTTSAITIGNACGDASASGNCSIAIGCGVASGPDKSIAIGNNVKTFSCGSAVVCSVVGCTATIWIPEGTKKCDAYKLLFADTDNLMLFNGMYWSTIGQSGYMDTAGQYSSITRLSYSNDAKAFYVNGFPIWNGATNVELTIETFQETDTTTTSKFILFTYTRIGG